ncbi:ABC transporter substrate-binding protein [Pontibacillus chungwhensis BH030062]|uniref:ABC transporter substrate-binding protein n=1 Tax=Pontibacillus chungwhensis BH030062 TaxID=1385513 RepID=A0A0A2UPX7_9BACI|nr:cobalamin-binding protein [Pontibacillus chungwhensis]KGP89999.1 ABC transporter substrate-binding protein [Pontibacillus chungwhensis BH030062]
MRLVSICPSNTELLAYLGLTDQLVGVDQYSDWPEEVKDLPQLGPDLSIDMDLVERLTPDLVLASLSVPGMERNIEELERRNLPYIILNPNSLEEIAEDLIKVGAHTQTEQKAEEVVHAYRSIIAQYQQLTDNIKDKPSLYWEWWPKPIFSPGGPNWLTKISELAGGQNVFSQENEASVQRSWEDVRELNPDVVCMAWVGVKEEKMKPEAIRKRPGWKEVQAVKDNRIFVLQESLYCRPSPRLLWGLQKLAHLLHPEVYPSPDKEDPLFKLMGGC